MPRSGLITFSFVVGLTITRVGKLAQPLADFFMALETVVTRILRLILCQCRRIEIVYLRFGIIGIPSLIAHEVLNVDDLLATAQSVAMFILTVTTGTRQNPYKFLRGLTQAALTGFGTSSRFRLTLASLSSFYSDCNIIFNLFSIAYQAGNIRLQILQSV
ncbi:hypothetical protein COOONC_16659 [Cooperia oncophora]